jgi:hypothetical protein
VHAMLSAYVERFYTRLAAGNLRHLRTLIALSKAFLGGLRASSSGDGGGAVEVRSLNDFLFSCGADNVNMFALTRYLKESKVAHKIAGRVDTSHVILQSKHQLMTASIIHVTIRHPGVTTLVGRVVKDTNL